MYRLLIVEDDRGIAEAIAQQAHTWELETKCVSNFRDVMKDFAEFDPHIVLMDITLPFFNGYHWCSQIRLNSSVPIIFYFFRLGQHEHCNGNEYGRRRLYCKAV